MAKAMIASATTATPPITRIGPRLRLPLTLTGVTGFLPLPPPAFLAGPDFFAAATVFLAGLVGGLPWPVVLPTLTEDGTRSGPGVLMLIVPRRFVVSGWAGLGWPPSAKVYPR